MKLWQRFKTWRQKRKARAAAAYDAGYAEWRERVTVASPTEPHKPPESSSDCDGAVTGAVVGGLVDGVEGAIVGGVLGSMMDDDDD